MSTENINKNNLINTVRYGKEEGIMITRDALNLFKEKFDVIIDEKCLVIKLKSEKEWLNSTSFYKELINYRTRFTLNKWDAPENIK